VNRLRSLDNPVKEAGRNGDLSLGAFLLSATSFVAEAMAVQPIDWLVIDMEASHASKTDLLHILQALNAYDVVPIVRTPDHSKHFIEACLDFGALGILVPKVDDADQAAAVARACRYPPAGDRSVNCIRASSYYTRAGPYLAAANQAVLAIVQIESARGVKQADAIAATSGIDALFLGPGDLAASYGQIGIVTGARMEAARRCVVEACRSHGKIPGIFAHSVESARQYVDEGFTMIALENDVKFLSSAMADALGRVRAGAGEAAAVRLPGPAAREPASYSSPTLQVWHHSIDFAADARFSKAYEAGMATAGDFLARAGIGPDVRHEWPVAVACWAAAHASHLEGDFVECGTNTGILGRAICEYLDFNALDKAFFLFDTWLGIPSDQMSEAEKALGREALSDRVYRDCYAETARTFAPFPRVRLVRGAVPQSLSRVTIDRVCYLSLDMNVAYPEFAALCHFWDRLVPGAPVLLDDYGKQPFVEQKAALDAFAFSKGVTILNLPTGQGLVLKP
jgi:2-keto-3-deoxy-L-rhamnonate aldolase RhmA